MRVVRPRNRKATELNPEHFRGFKLLGSALYALGDFKGASKALKQSLKLRPDYADAHCDLGCTYCAMGQAEYAQKCFNNAITINPKHLEVSSPSEELCFCGVRLFSTTNYASLSRARFT